MLGKHIGGARISYEASFARITGGRDVTRQVPA